MHSECRAMPTAWYLPPLSLVHRGGGGRERTDDEVDGAIDDLRISLHHGFVLLPDGCAHRSQRCG
jgi:nitrate reductase beta subunit